MINSNSMTSSFIDPDTERFTVAIFVATIIHIIMIYLVGFELPKSAKHLTTTTMEVILIQKRTEDSAEKADYLAQVSHKGGGDQFEELRPVTPTIAPFPANSAAIVYTSPSPQLAQTKKSQITTLTTTKVSTHKIIQNNDSSENLLNTKNNLSFLNASAVNLASIQAELNNKFEQYSKRPFHKFISSSTQIYKYAKYMDTWRRKVEEIGNLNYPDKARSQKLSGHLILDVALNSNGTIYKVEIKQASPYKILDEAALRIVHLAAPFEAFPENIQKETDILHITRTWEFRYNNLTSR
jgi:protein TonB